MPVELGGAFKNPGNLSSMLNAYQEYLKGPMPNVVLQYLQPLTFGIWHLANV